MALASLLKRTFLVPWAARTPKIFPKSANKLCPDILIEEENLPHYKAERYYPVEPGQVLSGYQVISKLGYGVSSTVWLAWQMNRWSWQQERYVALRISTRIPQGQEEEEDVEQLVTHHIARANPHHSGYEFVRGLDETFAITGPKGVHTCYVHELLREPQYALRSRFVRNVFPLFLLKAFIRFILSGLNYLHSECHVIHTDLKEGNILVTIEDDKVIPELIKSVQTKPLLWKESKSRHPIFESRNDFGNLKAFDLIPKLADFGCAERGDVEGCKWVHPIQPNAYRAPEVLLGTGWSYSADIWNLGLVMWNMLEDRDLFVHIRPDGGNYSGAAHLAEMIALLGPPPKSMVDEAIEENEKREWRWNAKAQNAQGKLCDHPVDYWGGPFFDAEGNFLHEHLIPKDLQLEDTLPSLEAEERAAFLAFARKMLQWAPKDRKTAQELLDDPFLEHEMTSHDRQIINAVQFEGLFSS